MINASKASTVTQHRRLKVSLRQQLYKPVLIEMPNSEADSSPCGSFILEEDQLHCGLWLVQTTSIRPQVAGQCNPGSEAGVAVVRGELPE